MSRHESMLARAVLYHLTARLFTYPEDGLDAGLTAATAAAAVLRDRGRTATALAALREAWQASRQGEPGAAEEYTYLFLKNVRCPLHETGYNSERILMRAHDMAELAGYYAAFGVQVAPDFRDLPDHVSMELEFLSFLYAKEAYAIEQGWKGRAEEARAARRRFLTEHLGNWFAQLAARLLAQARLPLYPAAAALVQALLDGERFTTEARVEQAAIAPA